MLCKMKPAGCLRGRKGLEREINHVRTPHAPPASPQTSHLRLETSNPSSQTSNPKTSDLRSQTMQCAATDRAGNHGGGAAESSSSSMLLSILELSDTPVYEPSIRALLGNAEPLPVIQSESSHAHTVHDQGEIQQALNLS